jgi:hypothetical protein
MRRLAAFLLCSLLPAAIVDKLAITVGNTVITELQIDEDLRVAALLNGRAIARDLEARRAAADRLVEQLLIQHEIELSRYPAPSDEEVNALFSQIEKNLGGPERVQQLLLAYDVSRPTLRAHLLAQLGTLRFVGFRFRPDITISEREIEAEYDRLTTALKTTAANPPALGAGEKARLSDALLEERTDAALNGWLAESRKQINIVYLDKDLQ